MVVFKRQKAVNLVDSLVDQLEKAICAGKFKPGEKLPSSSTLEKALGASRGTLREAIRVLQQKGLVESRVGVKGGVFVRLSSPVLFDRWLLELPAKTSKS